MEKEHRVVWYAGERWSGLLGREREGNGMPEPCPFPLDEVLYQLLLKARIKTSPESVERLEQLREEYRRLEPEFTAPLEDLIREGWIDVFCGRWSTVGYVNREWAEEVKGRKVGGILRFLAWLQRAGRTDCSGVCVDDLTGELDRLRMIYPSLPGAEWFVEKRIIGADQIHFYHSWYGGIQVYFYMALVRLWLYGEMDHERWADLVSQLYITARVLDSFPYGERSKVVEILTKRALAGKVPTAAAENNRINRHFMLERRKPQLKTDGRQYLSEDDPVENLLQVERMGWEELHDRFARDAYLRLEIAAAAEYASFVPDESLTAILDRLSQLHKIGALNTLRLPIGTYIRLLEYRQTRFLALQSLALLHRERLAEEGGPAMGNCILAWLHDSLQGYGLDELESVGRLLLYLAEYAYRRTKVAQRDTELLRGILRELGQAAESKLALIRTLTEELCDQLDRSKGLTWSRRFQLLCDWTEVWFQSASASQDSEQLEEHFRYLRKQMKGLFEAPRDDRADFLPPTIFRHSFWPRLYDLADQNERYLLRDPVRPWFCKLESEPEERFQARAQFCLALAWLTALMGAHGAEDEMEMAFESFLAYVLHSENQLLTSLWCTSQEQWDAVQEAVQALNVRPESQSPLFQLDAVGLLTVIRYTRDDGLRETLVDRLKGMSWKQDSVDPFDWEQVIQDVLTWRLEFLYATCEEYLKGKLTEWKAHEMEKRPFYGRAVRQLSCLWFCEGDFDRVLKEGDDWGKALVYLSEGPLQDLRKAASGWRQLAREGKSPAAFQNWMAACLQMLEKANEEELRRGLCRTIQELHNEIKGRYFSGWRKEDQLRYAQELATYRTFTGSTEEEALRQVIGELELDVTTTDQLREIWAHKPREEGVQALEVPMADPGTALPVGDALREYMGLPFLEKVKCYLESRHIPMMERWDIALVLREVIRTLYHLELYGDKLLYEEKLDEDHCTQLFREFFNAGVGEWWRISANDQQQSGSTGKHNRVGVPESAENDLVIRENEYELMVLEAIVMERFHRDNLCRHLLKLIGDSRNRPMSLLIYGNSKTSQELWEEVKKYLCQEFAQQVAGRAQIEEFQELSRDQSFYNEGLYPHAGLNELVDLSLATRVTHPGGKDLPLFVLYADIGHRGHTELSKVARER